jgi:tRNA1Val (adenine37-N6)-methyltransferase
MKVGTDGVLLGAWTAINKAKDILDIGTGTGLIALMLAQRSTAIIDAIEIDRDAACQAIENIKSSPWHNRIHVYNTSLQHYSLHHKQYDLIVSNPPFFQNALPAPDPKRMLARHNQQLSMSELVLGVKRLLTSDGRFCFIVPPDVFRVFTELAEKQLLFPVRQTHVRPAPNRPVKRILAAFSSIRSDESVEELIIESNGRHGYSEEYIELTSGFYLDLRRMNNLDENNL